MTHHALLVCDGEPRDGVSGQHTYNLLVIDLLGDLGYEVDLLVTGFEEPGRHGRDGRIGQVDRLHFRPFAGAWVPISLAALARRWKRRFAAGAPGPNAARVAKIGRFLTGREKRRIVRHPLFARADIVVIDTVFRSPFDLPSPGPRGRRPTRVLIEHDLFHRRTASFRRNGYDVRPAVSREMEEDVYRRFDVVVAISEPDAAAIAAAAPAVAVVTLLPGTAPVRSAGGSKLDEILYVGSGATHNVDGLQWFLRHCWAPIRDARPDAILHVVGSIGDRLSDAPGVVRHGRLDDFGAVAGRCSFAINPVRMGSGVKVKVVDYINAGLGCVTTSLGAEGFPADDDLPLVIADGEPAFAAAAVRCLADKELAHDLGRRALRYRVHFGMEAARARLAAALAPPEMTG